VRKKGSGEDRRHEKGGEIFLYNGGEGGEKREQRCDHVRQSWLEKKGRTRDGVKMPSSIGRTNNEVGDVDTRTKEKGKEKK